MIGCSLGVLKPKGGLVRKVSRLEGHETLVGGAVSSDIHSHSGIPYLCVFNALIFSFCTISFIIISVSSQNGMNKHAVKTASAISLPIYSIKVQYYMCLRENAAMNCPCFSLSSFSRLQCSLADHCSPAVNLRLTDGGHITADVMMDFPPMDCVLLDPHNG